MWRPGIFVAASLFSSSAALAGDIFGSLREAGAPRAGVEYQVIDPGGNRVADSRTASNGSFHVSLQPGRYRLMVSFPGNPWAEIVASNGPAQYDFELIRRSDGNYVLVRR